MKFIKTLSRDEMKNVMAGIGGPIPCSIHGEDYRSCKCYEHSVTDPEPLGTACCSPDIDYLLCCQVQHNNTSAVDCSV